MILTPDLSDRYTESGTALVSRDMTWWTEIGDTKDAAFQPQVKLCRWDNEVNFSMRLVSGEAGAVDYAGKEVRWAAPSGIEAKFYDLGFAEGGGFEFEVWLPARPVSNVIEFSLRHKGLSFEYQPALADEYPRGLPDGITAERPENVVGSYAVYHANRAHGKYTTGKAFHLYRPWAEDRNGVRVWCALAIDAAANRLTIAVPQAFLDAAVYPVLIDPTLGYTTIGASEVGLVPGDIGGFGQTGTTGYTMAENGTATFMNIYAAGQNNGTFNLTLGLYNHGTNYPGTLFADTAGTDFTVTSGVFAWRTIAIAGSLVSGSSYWPAMNHGTGALNLQMKYDSATDALKWKASTYVAGALDDPFPSAANVFSGKISSYADYTTAGGATPKGPLGNPLYGPFGGPI